ncbi:MAG: ABC transporter ATP-binding protein, partial [Deltaproteobacteria bacterium]|nr:ABC transporter ATP-binding protein [Deltaproteobacteria bacterium]
YAPPAEQEGLRAEILMLNAANKPMKAAPKKQIRKPAVSEDPSGSAYFDPHLVPKSRVSYRSRGARISDFKIVTPTGMVVNHLIRRQEYIYTYTVDFTETAFSVRPAMLIKTLRGMDLGGAMASKIVDSIPVIEAGTRLHVQFKFRCLLSPGTYFLNAGVEGVVDGVKTYLHRLIDAAMFRV